MGLDARGNVTEDTIRVRRQGGTLSVDDRDNLQDNNGGVHVDMSGKVKDGWPF